MYSLYRFFHQKRHLDF